MKRFSALKEAIWYPVSTFEEREVRAAAAVAENNNRAHNIFAWSTSRFLDAFPGRARSSDGIGPQVGSTNGGNTNDDNDGHPGSSHSLEQGQQEQSMA